MPLAKPVVSKVLVLGSGVGVWVRVCVACWCFNNPPPPPPPPFFQCGVQIGYEIFFPQDLRGWGAPTKNTRRIQY